MICDHYCSQSVTKKIITKLKPTLGYNIQLGKGAEILVGQGCVNYQLVIEHLLS